MLGTPPTFAAAQGMPRSMASPSELGLFSRLLGSRKTLLCKKQVFMASAFSTPV